MKALTIVLALAALTPTRQAQFVAVEIYANSDGKGLAAWQIELQCDPAKATIVGVEGGEKPPYYDPAALQGGRIILASFTTESQPPAGRVLVARVHLQETGKTDYAVNVMAAAAPGGERIEPRIDLVRAGGK